MATTSLSISQARRLALAAQGFGVDRTNGVRNWLAARNAIERMGLLQMDSINTIIRSHYMPLYSRLGAYDRGKLDARAFQAKGRELFEYWAHEASLLPMQMYPILRWRMDRARRHEGIYKECARLAQERPDFIKGILKRLEDTGPLSSRAFNERGSGKGMWDWHEGKTGLEYLFWTGQITTHSRVGFERMYDLTDRVIPAGVLNQPVPGTEESHRELLKFSAKALGVATESDLRDYFRLSAADVKPRIPELVENGDLIPVKVENWTQPAYVTPDLRLPRKMSASTVLTPFDPIVWERKRTQRLFDFEYRIEIYVPAHKRKFGYYVLPFLLDERLAARLDLKADREAGTLKVLGSYCEPDLDTSFVAERLAPELERFAQWLGLNDVSIDARGDMSKALKDVRR